MQIYHTVYNTDILLWPGVPSLKLPYNNFTYEGIDSAMAGRGLASLPNHMLRYTQSLHTQTLKRTFRMVVWWWCMKITSLLPVCCHIALMYPSLNVEA